MARPWGLSCRTVLGISPDAASFARRGFRSGCAATRGRLERAGEAFLVGYGAALDDPTPGPLAARLRATRRDDEGFAFEGAAMALALLDGLTPWRRPGRLGRFLEEQGAAHVYMIHVGVGWAWARLRIRPGAAMRRLDPLLGWLAIDGYGFHQGYFRGRRFVGRGGRPRGLSGYALRAFDQGLGRSLWFIECGDPAGVAAAIAALGPARHADLWSGLGLACAYAGGVGDEALRAVRAAAGPHAASAAQGAAFAARARQRAGNPAEATERACRLLCGRSADAAAEVAARAERGLPADGVVPAYEIWRQRIRAGLLVTREAVS